MGKADPEDPPEAGREATLTLAHALRTPLTSLALGLGMLDEGSLGALTDAQREVVRVLVGDVARLMLLVDRALQTDRLGAYAGPIERVPVDLGELVARAGVPIVEQARARGVHVARCLPGELTVVADPAKIGWVAVSLMGNALRYSPPGGTIDVRLSVVADHAELQVSDQGPGLHPSIRDRIFERRDGHGLFLAREIVEAHGGSIRVSSQVGRGCAFTFTLPIARGGRAQP